VTGQTHSESDVYWRGVIFTTDAKLFKDQNNSDEDSVDDSEESAFDREGVGGNRGLDSLRFFRVKDAEILNAR
jgi:hypothetical protein